MRKTYYMIAMVLWASLLTVSLPLATGLSCAFVYLAWTTE